MEIKTYKSDPRGIFQLAAGENYTWHCAWNGAIRPDTATEQFYRNHNKKLPIMNYKSSLTLAFVALASGVALGVLIAPASGQQTRKRIRKSVVGVKDTLGYAALRAEDHLSDLRSKVSDLTSAAEEKVTKAKAA